VIPERATESTEVTVTNGSNDGPITLELSTELPADSWKPGRNESVFNDDEYAKNVSVSGETATIQLNSSKTYNLRIHKVDIGSGASEPEPTYLQHVSYDDPDLNFTVRDQFNDPVEESVDVWVFNDTEVAETSTEEAIEKSVALDEVDDPCGVALDDDIGSTVTYERINATGAC